MWRNRLSTTPLPGDRWRGFVPGVAAGVLAFTLTALLRVVEISRSPAGFRLYMRPDGADGMLSVLAGTFYGAHPGAYDAPVWLDTVLQRYGTVPEGTYVLVVAGVLVAAGWVAAGRESGDSAGAIDSARRGATITIGYAPAIVLGALALEVLVDLGPPVVVLDQFLGVVLVAGVIAPAVGGAVGGLLLAWLRAVRSPESHTSGDTISK